MKNACVLTAHTLHTGYGLLKSQKAACTICFPCRTLNPNSHPVLSPRGRELERGQQTARLVLGRLGYCERLPRFGECPLPSPPLRVRERVAADSGVAGRLKKNARNINSRDFQVAFIARQMEQTPRAFFQTTFEPIGRVCAARHARGGLGLQGKWRTRACVPHTPYMRATTCSTPIDDLTVLVGSRTNPQNLIDNGITMLIEQAFFNLPEIMVGNGYAKTEYEGGIVSAFSLALLQELNGRNINNPISCINAEKRYHEEYNYRSDLHINLNATNLNNTSLREYGFRQNNYLEAKFFRGTQSNTTDNILKILLDLYRIMLMPIKNENKPHTNIGRYFLHVYLGSPKDFFGKKFSWLLAITKQGIQNIQIQLTENTTAFNIFPQDFQANIRINNLCIQSDFEIENKLYTFILSRIDEFKLINTNDKTEYEVSQGGIVSQTCNHEDWIRYFVEKTKPSSDKEVIYDNFLNYLPINELVDIDKIKENREKLASSRGKRITSPLIIDEIISFIESKKEEENITELITKLKNEGYNVDIKENLIEYLATEITRQTNPKDNGNYSQFKTKLKTALSESLKNLQG